MMGSTTEGLVVVLFGLQVVQTLHFAGHNTHMHGSIQWVNETTSNPKRHPSAAYCSFFHEERQVAVAT
jgi:hypothetical protein